MSFLVASFWEDMLAAPWARAVAGILILCILIAFGFYLLSSFRDYAGGDRQAPHFADSNLQEMLRRGDISEAEFRTIQSKSYGVSMISGEPESPSFCPARDTTVDASRQDEMKRPDNFLPPSIT